MTRILIIALFLAFSPFAAFAQTTCPTCVENPPVDEGDNPTTGPAGGGSSQQQLNLTYEGGETLPFAKVVYIFWGAVPASYAAELQAYRDVDGGMTDHLWMLAQYDAQQGSLKGSQNDVFDPEQPPAEVTDAAAQAEVRKHFSGRYDYNAIYVIVLPYGVVSSQNVNGSGIKRSCSGEVTGQMCGYHNYFRNVVFGPTVKYAVIPYASCSGCRKFTAEGVWANDVQNAEIITLHEVRSVMTNPELDGWSDNIGREADDKCAFFVDGATRPENIFRKFTPGGSTHTPYYTPGHVFFFQKEWSNNLNSSWSWVPGGCVE